ncbi:MAG TPA: immunoglobulin domain-containing protein, partial [Alphaproteobacteria bacterium]|nr:immunoglobulin domain-containing protein [Alphaproteobacteria bacterium]
MKSLIGSYQLFKSTGAPQVGTGKFSLVLATVLLAKLTQAQTLYWDPSTNGFGVWDTTTPNWSTSSSTTISATWAIGDVAYFSSAPVFASSYTVSLGGTETAGALSFANGTATLTNGTLALSGSGSVVVGSSVEGIIASPIIGSAGLTKSGAGQLDLQGENTFTGNLTNKAGVLTLDSDQAGGDGMIVLNPSGPVILNSSLPVATLSNNVALLGAGSSAEIDAATGKTLVLSGNLSGPHNWLANGPGMLVLSNANSFAGVLTVMQGTVVAAVDASLGGVANNVIVSNNATLAFQGGFTYSSDKIVELNGFGAGGGAAFNSISGDNVFEGSVVLAANSVVGVSAGSLDLVGPITGPSYNLVTTGAGELDLTSSGNNYGSTSVSSGTLGVWNPANAGTGQLSVNSGATLVGDSSVAAPGGVSLSGTIYPGGGLYAASFGTASETWNGGAGYNWVIDDANGPAGSDPGYSTLNISGTLTINTTSANPITIHLISFDANSDSPGPVDDFDDTAAYQWTIATASGGISGFNAADFVIDPSGIQNDLGNGAFIVQQVGNSIVVSFVQKPQISAGPLTQTIDQCDPATFTVAATGSGTLDYQWFYNSTPIGGANSSSFTINDVAFGNAGSYSVTVSNLSGYTAMSSAILTVTNPPPFVQAGNSITVALNNGGYMLTAANVAALAGGSYDHCGPAFIRSTNIAPSVFGCSDVGTQTVTVTLEDISNQQSTASATVIVQDVTPPSLVLTPITVALDQSGNYSLNSSDITRLLASSSDNNCSIATTNITPNTFSFCDVGTNPVSVTLTDIHGVSSNGTVDVIVQKPANPPSVVYVDSSYPTNCGLVAFPNSGGGGANYYFGYNAFNTIQGGVNAVAAGGTVNVAAGTYTEEVTIAEPMTLLGPNATNNPNTSTRATEAVIEPDISDPNIYDQNAVEMISLETSNIVIKGFTVDGYNPDLGEAYQSGSDSFNAAIGIGDYTGDSSIKIENNIIKNDSYAGLDLESDDNGSPPNTNSYIKCNLFENFDYNTEGFGFAVLLANNYYAKISGNWITNAAIGISAQNYSQANPGNSGSEVIASNTVYASILGIWPNLIYGSASTFEIVGNLSAFMPTNGSPVYAPMEWDGFSITSVQNAVGVVASNNIVTGPSGSVGYNAVGFNVWNTPTTGPVLITGGSVSNVNYGVWVNDFDGYQSPGGSTMAVISNLTVAGASSAGIYMQDDPRASANGVTVLATVTGNTVITGSAIGVLVQGTNAAASIINNSSSISGNGIGISVDTGKALIQNNDLTGNSTAGISVTNNAIVDAGNCAGNNLTGLGASDGENNLSG